MLLFSLQKGNLVGKVVFIMKFFLYIILIDHRSLIMYDVDVFGSFSLRVVWKYFLVQWITLYSFYFEYKLKQWIIWLVSVKVKKTSLKVFDAENFFYEPMCKINQEKIFLPSLNHCQLLKRLNQCRKPNTVIHRSTAP